MLPPNSNYSNYMKNRKKRRLSYVSSLFSTNLILSLFLNILKIVKVNNVWTTRSKRACTVLGADHENLIFESWNQQDAYSLWHQLYKNGIPFVKGPIAYYKSPLYLIK